MYIGFALTEALALIGFVVPFVFHYSSHADHEMRVRQKG